MSRPFARGAVVTHGHRFGVVWSHDGRGLVILPIEQPDRLLVSDVLLELSDLIACGAPVAHAAIRPASCRRVRAESQVQVGTVPGATMCLVVRSLIRLTAEAQFAERWSGDRAHRSGAQKPVVRMVG